MIRYSYLWLDEHRFGREEGRKDRPCAIVLTASTTENVTSVVVVPITHSQPTGAALVVEIPTATKRRLGLDAERSWIVLSEANSFVWPGPDLRPLRSGDAASVSYGELPGNLFRQLRAAFLDAHSKRRARLVQRTQ